MDTAIRSWWMAAAMFVAAVGNCTSRAGEVYVTPDGTPDGRGTRQSPVDLATATTNSQLVAPGTTVWIGPGIYQVGLLQPHESIHGSKDKPIIYRALPGRPATVVGEIRPNNDYVWYWGLDVKGGVTVRVRSTGLKLINLTIHEAGPAEKPAERKPSGQGIGGGDVGDDQEIYGNIIYHNGWNTLDHGLYVQNTVRHTVKRFVDNIVFENAGCGFHLYGQSPQLSGLYLEGNISFATSLNPRCPSNGEMNILTGGSKPITHLVLKNNCTYHPNPASKRGVDVGFRGSPNSDIRIEDNYFMCGANAMELNGAAEAVVRNNTFWAPVGMVAVKLPSAGQSQGDLCEQHVHRQRQVRSGPILRTDSLRHDRPPCARQERAPDRAARFQTCEPVRAPAGASRGLQLGPPGPHEDRLGRHSCAGPGVSRGQCPGFFRRACGRR